MAKNPQYALNQMLSSNPQLQQIMGIIKNNGGDPQTAFYNYAKQLGINPDDILNILK